MLKSLALENVGPAPRLAVEWASRLNFITGDNGLGKTFLLDIAWWALTRTWARLPVIPTRRHQPQAMIEFCHTTATGKDHTYESRFDRDSQSWSARQGRPPIPGLVLYAQVDGGFSVWDPARNYWKGGGSSEQAERPRAYLFRPEEVWDGLPLAAAAKLCNGLISDWASWKRENNDAFRQLTSVLDQLSPSGQERLAVGNLTRVSLSDVRDHPTLVMPYGQEVPLIHVSAGMRRIVALAYLLVWTWQEHLKACELRGSTPVREVIFLVDEIEAHLHPKWQRRIVPALLTVMEALTGQHQVQVQLLTATHSPLILASVEPHFDQAQDALWTLDLEVDGVAIRPAWRRRGDVNGWLASDIFELEEPRSLEAENALRQARELLRQPSPSGTDLKATDRDLREVLGELDPFWVRWSAFMDAHASNPPGA